MKLEDQALTHRSTVAKPPPPPRSRVAPTPLATEVLERLSGHGPRSIAYARGRLGLMGGVSDYAGVLVLHSLAEPRVCVGVRRHHEATIRITPCAGPKGNGAGCEIKLSDLPALVERAAAAVAAHHPAHSADQEYATCLLGAVAEACCAGWAPCDGNGFTLAVASELHSFNDVGVDAAVICAALVALAHLLNRPFDAADAIEICRNVQNRWLGWPVDGSDAACVLHGTAGNVGAYRVHTDTSAEFLPLEPLTLVGLESGALSSDARRKYTRVRTASFMGRLLIQRILAHEANDRAPRDLPLAAIPVQEYVTRFRDRLPTRLKGSDFLDRFGETGDPLTRVEPDVLYKVRSRTEHHIYEQDRARQWISVFNGGRRPDDPSSLRVFGELMSASHWSYGQRCGLGSIETDLLTQLLHCESAAGSDFVGAKISGRGSGGVVTVLLRATDRAWEALERVRLAFGRKTGCEARLLLPSSDDSALDGAQLY